MQQTIKLTLPLKVVEVSAWDTLTKTRNDLTYECDGKIWLSKSGSIMLQFTTNSSTYDKIINVDATRHLKSDDQLMAYYCNTKNYTKIDDEGIEHEYTFTERYLIECTLPTPQELAKSGTQEV